MRSITIFLAFAGIVLSASVAFPQKVVLNIESNEPLIFKRIDYEKVQTDSSAAFAELNRVVTVLQDRSFLTASVVEGKFRNDTLYAVIDVGASYQWVDLREGNLPEIVKQHIGFNVPRYKKKKIHFAEIRRLKEKILDYSENIGYPFATVWLDSILISENGIDAAVCYQAGLQVRFDSIEIRGDVQLKKEFLSNYLRIHPGQLYSQQKVERAEKRINELPYLKIARPSIVEFYESSAKLILFLAPKKANQLDGIIGFLPNTGDKKKLMITGQLNVQLYNLLGSGKILHAEWNRMNVASQLLNLMYAHPKVLGSNFDIRLNFDFFKQDSSFINITRSAGITHPLRTGNLNFNSLYKTSNQLGKMTIEDSSRILNYPNFNFFSYGLGYTWNNLDDIYYPIRGWSIAISCMYGNKNVRKNPILADSFYNNIGLKTQQLNVSFDVQRFYKLSLKGILAGRVTGGKIYNNNNNLFYNDLFRIGGLKTLRGFNENHFYVSDYIIGLAEYRYMIDRSSYMFLFYNQGLLKNSLLKINELDWPLGFGAGISFNAGPGIFTFVYSLGQSFDQPLSLALSKIHFGLVSRF